MILLSLDKYNSKREAVSSTLFLSQLTCFPSTPTTTRGQQNWEFVKNACVREGERQKEQKKVCVHDRADKCVYLCVCQPCLYACVSRQRLHPAVLQRAARSQRSSELQDAQSLRCLQPRHSSPDTDTHPAAAPTIPLLLEPQHLFGLLMDGKNRGKF